MPGALVAPKSITPQAHAMTGLGHCNLAAGHVAQAGSLLV